ncbi:MAG: SRPBCC family protein [Bacteroidales bacterium]|nr:SRPBCC family protein [Bacteroidales bacterium]HNW74902.1 SRPBCC family protein [Bacteroidales bacterium]HPS51853.1 SRPBCC family protein [Bacteroidales bacterium]
MKDFKKYYHIPASPEMVYTALTNPVTLELWTGEPAEMTEEPGSDFSLFDGSINGRNLSFEPGKKIVQQWYFGNAEPPSIVTILLHPEGGNTSVELSHTNIPDTEYESISTGWTKYFFQPLMAFYK